MNPNSVTWYYNLHNSWIYPRPDLTAINVSGVRSALNVTEIWTSKRWFDHWKSVETGGWRAGTPQKLKQSIWEGEQWEYRLWVTGFDCVHLQSTDTDPESCFESIVNDIDLHVIQSCWMAIRIEIQKIRSSLKHKYSINKSLEFPHSVIPVQHSSIENL